MFKLRAFFNLHKFPAFLLLIYPIVLAFLLEFFLQDLSFSSHLNLLENILFFVIVTLLVNQLSFFKNGKKIANIIIVIYYASLCIETGLYLLFQTRLNAAYIHVILNTNFIEVKEFSTIYFKNNLVFLLFFFVPLLKFFPKKIYKNINHNNKNFFFSFASILLVFIIMKFTALLYWNFPYVVLKSGIQYQNQLKVFDDFGKRNINLNANLVTDNDLIVIIIGESTTRNHMGIYGYRRNTTPKLEELSDSLFIYNNVISSHVFTTASLYDAFTITKSNQTTFLIDYIKKAGYKVYWLSNQRPIGFHDNLVSRIASAANESIFLSYNDFRHKTFYDEVLFPMIDEKLLIKEKKVVFVHLIGTHYDYSKRYPEKFNVFKSKKQDKKNKIIDTYDNSILYNDLIVSEIIKKVKLKNEKSAVLYFSDHGEEVYDVVDYFGHFADKPTSTMYEIPFLLYKASSFEEPNNFIIDENRSFMLDDLPESLIHLMGIESESIDNSKSIFSLDFKNEMRLIDNGLDFESFKFKENK